MFITFAVCHRKCCKDSDSSFSNNTHIGMLGQAVRAAQRLPQAADAAAAPPGAGSIV